MKSIVFTFGLVILGFGFATLAQTQTESAEQELIKLENELMDAWLKRDIAFYDRILADDYTGTEENGNFMTKAQELADIESGPRLSTYGVLDNIKVRVYGEAAVVTSRSTMKGQYKGKEFSNEYQQTHTFIKRDGSWRCVASHISRIPHKKRIGEQT